MWREQELRWRDKELRSVDEVVIKSEVEVDMRERQFWWEKALRSLL